MQTIITKPIKATMASLACFGMVTAGGCKTLELAPDIVSSLPIPTVDRFPAATALVCLGFSQSDSARAWCAAAITIASLAAQQIRNDEIGREIKREEDKKAREGAIGETVASGEARQYETEDGDIGIIEQTNVFTNSEGDPCTTNTETFTTAEGEEKTVVHNVCEDKDGNPYYD